MRPARGERGDFSPRAGAAVPTPPAQRVYEGGASRYIERTKLTTSVRCAAVRLLNAVRAAAP
jgi:hypothetical protein